MKGLQEGDVRLFLFDVDEQCVMSHNNDRREIIIGRSDAYARPTMKNVDD
jgi:hypothetical protein